MTTDDMMAKFYRSWRGFVFDPLIPFSRKEQAVFRHQLAHQPLYRKFCAGLGIDGSEDETPEIPLMPIQVFRDGQVRADYVRVPEAVFRSSGTTGLRQSTHEIADLSLYHESCLQGFSHFYDPDDFILLAYLPGYRDNPNSSLIAMIEHLISRDPTGKSRFLPLDQPIDRVLDRAAGRSQDSSSESSSDTSYDSSHDSPADPPPDSWSDPSPDISPHRSPEPSPDRSSDPETGSKSRRIMLFGAAFGLLDVIDMGAPALPPGSVVVETGGMKTRRREIAKSELRRRLADGFGVPPDAVHSEYGMAEMCSQAWDTGGGTFRCPPWLRISIRDPENPLSELPDSEEGLVGVTDLANVHSLSFFLTQDRGVAHPDGSFEVLGRWDHAELRGCNFLLE